MNYITDIFNKICESINAEVLLKTLIVMGQGMLGIFVVMILIMLSTVILNKCTAPAKEKDNK